jgi:mRNA-degrading endonuclease RelE of RelBE toxin-antitoxin system
VPYEIIFEPDAVEHLQRFSARAQSIVLDQIEVQLTYQPDVETRNRNRLRSNPLAPWELCIGENRVFYDVNANAVSVRIIAVGRKEGSQLIRGREEISLSSVLPSRVVA